jgi:transcriptional regulator with GAF, ATPase, and Fis domain
MLMPQAEKSVTDVGSLDRLSWRNWWILSITSFATVGGLSVAIYLLAQLREQQVWPWRLTELGLAVAVTLCLLTLVVYLTVQQRIISSMQARVQNLIMENERRTRQHYNRLIALFEVTHMVGYHSDLTSIFDGITSSCNSAFQADWASLMLFEPDSQRLVVASASGDPLRTNLVGTSRRLGEGVSGWVAQHRRSLCLTPSTDTDEYPGLQLNNKDIRSSMIVPIIVNEELVGIVSVAAGSDTQLFDDEDLRTLEVFAENAGISIRHAQEITWLRQAAGPALEPEEESV